MKKNMRHEQTAPSSVLLASAPLALAYLLLPFCEAAGRFGLAGRGPDWLTPHWPWLALAGVGLFASLGMKSKGARQHPLGPLLTLAALCGGATLAALAAWQAPLPGEEALRRLAWLNEAAPLAYMGLAALWVTSFGAPAARTFALFGAALGTLSLVDAGLSSVFVHHLAPGGLLLSPQGGETRACLLGAALLLGVDDKSRQGQYPAWTTILVMGGLLVSGSPMALLACGAAYLFLSRERIEARIGFALACAGGVLSPLLGGPAALEGRMQVYVLWAAGVERFSVEPLGLLTGFGPGILELNLPVELASVLGMPGVSFTLPPSEISSFWLRLGLVWGIVPILFVLGAGLLLTGLTQGRAIAALTALIITMGTVFPLFFAGAPAMALSLAVACLLAGQGTQGDAESVSTPSPENPPA
ncbi:MAG: hypothetical protein V3573_00360 [Desulfovibrionaceae bacterium]